MELDELRYRAAQERERSVEYPEYQKPESLSAQQSPSIPLIDYVAGLEPSGKRRRAVYRHILGPPAMQQAIDAWQERWPNHPLPTDLRRLVEQVNGIHLWADTAHGRAYTGIAPIEQWRPARVAMYGELADHSLLPEKYLALSYHADGSSYVVLDVVARGYFLMDSCGPDESCPLGSCVSELLDWLWASRLPPN